MDMQEHLAELSAQHHRLEQLIKDELGHPFSNSIRVADLKRQKLRIKDEMAQLERRRLH